MTHSAQSIRSAPPRVVRFGKAARYAHWGHTATYLILLLTGLLLFAPKVFGWVGPAFLGANTAGTVHRVVAVFYTIIPIACLIANPKGFVAWWKDVFSFGKSDIEFIMKFPFEFFGLPVKMPASTQFNGGEKMNSVVTTTSCIFLAISGYILWFPEAFSVGLVRWMVPLHDICMILSCTMVCMHSYLGSFHPGSGESFWGMWKGTVRKDWAAHHHAKWLEKVEKGE